MLLNVRDVTKSFATNEGMFRKSRQQVLKGVSFSQARGECLGIVGESGSGKSTLGKVVLGLEKADSGVVEFAEDVAKNPLAKSVVFQDYNTSVNPRLTILESISEPLREKHWTVQRRKGKVAALLEEVGLDPAMMGRYPHQLSGGQLQRVCIARAIAPSPSFILFDEAVSSLDVSVQAQVLDVMLSLKKEHDIAFMFITHDITVATYVCDRLLFFKDGLVVEELSSMKELPYVTNDYAVELLQAAHYLEMPFAERNTHVQD